MQCVSQGKNMLIVTLAAHRGEAWGGQFSMFFSHNQLLQMSSRQNDTSVGAP